MAKKTKTEGVLARETRVRAEADARPTAEKASGAEREAAAQKRVIPPVAKAVRPKKAKKARLVREKQEKRAPVKAAELPARSTTAGGKMMSKKNTFTDFITVAEQLIADKYTSKDRLVIEGGSAGGLLLPGVAVEHKLDSRQFLEHVCVKAGLPTNAWQEDDTTLITFPPSACSGRRWFRCDRRAGNCRD